MDFEIIRARLIDNHATQIARLTPLLRGTARDHFAKGISACLRALQEQAVAEEAAAGEAVMPVIAPAISGPLGVQPSHSAVGSDEIPK